MKPSPTHSSRDFKAEPAFLGEGSSELFLSSQALEDVFREVLSKGMCCRFQAKGSSMSPFIRDGDVVTVAPLCSAAPGLGDVVICTSARRGRLFIHRVVEKRADSYLVKGDSLPEPDGVVQQVNILGYVSRVERSGQKVSFGLGPEKVLIAFLTRSGFLAPMLLLFRKAFHLSRRGLK